MRLERLSTSNAHLFERAFALYQSSFPAEERRDDSEQQRVLKKENSHFDLIMIDDNFIGVMLYWETENFVFLEHFTTLPDLRGKGYGKRVNALLHDNRTVLREGEDIEDWEEAQRKQREIEAERKKKEQEILATWFLREEYINAGWFKRFLLRLEFAFRDTRGEGHIPQIPDHIRMEIARCILPDIVAYFESEQGQREFEEWKAQQEALKKEKSEVA